ncbi:MAG: element excision factor XisI family protein [Pyrinomonadaceae bacterium]
MKKYRQMLRNVTEAHAQMSSPMDYVKSTAVSDFSQTNYFLIDFDSQDKKHYIVFHLCLKDGKVWIEQDGIEYGVAQDLIKAGVARQDIVLAFQDKEVMSESELIAV